MSPNIEQRLADIERTQERVVVLLESLTKQVGNQAAADEKWRGRIDLTLHGDGNGHRGALVRLDRLEQSHERARWLMRTLVAAVLGLLAKAVAGLFGA